MISRIPILLDEKTAAGLVALAKQEFRDPRQQAAMIIRDELQRRGLLEVKQNTTHLEINKQGEVNDASSCG